MIDLIGLAIVGSVLFLVAAWVHAQVKRKRNNFYPNNSGVVFYIDILVPIVTLVMIAYSAPW